MHSMPKIDGSWTTLPLALLNGAFFPGNNHKAFCFILTNVLNAMRNGRIKMNCIPGFEQNFFPAVDPFNSSFQDYNEFFARMIKQQLCFFFNRRVFNNKGLLVNSKVVDLCDLSTKNNAYLNFVLSLLKKNSDSSNRIRKAIVWTIANPDRIQQICGIMNQTCIPTLF